MQFTLQLLIALRVVGPPADHAETRSRAIADLFGDDRLCQENFH